HRLEGRRPVASSSIARDNHVECSVRRSRCGRDCRLIGGLLLSSSNRQVSADGPYLNSAQQDRTDPTNVGDTLASLKRRLRLSPEQEKNWSAFESAYRALSDYRRERMRVRQEQGLP